MPGPTRWGLLAIVAACACFAPDRAAASRPPARVAHGGARTRHFEAGIEPLLQHWVRSNEEEPPGGTRQVFRPAGSRAFPPSRFRMAYTFARGGGCRSYFLSPDDNHRFKPGRWTLDPRDSTQLQITVEAETTSFRIVELSRTLLRLEPEAPKPAR
jgi:hypothetical protein